MKVISKTHRKCVPKSFGKILASLGAGMLTENRYFTLGSKVDQLVSTAITSRIAYPYAVGAISITAGTGHYRINGGSWVDTDGVLVATDYIEARQTSSASNDTKTDLVFDYDGVADTFSVTTVSSVSYILDPDGNPILDPDGNPIPEF